jgi:(5-formylfuran-3-yl)methyl phosphate synthase
MTLFLASVRDKAEAEIALLSHADIIDLKDPSHGALGAVPVHTARRVVAAVAGRGAISATIGDLPMRPSVIQDAVLERAACGVDYVKFGLFPGGDPQGCLEALHTLTQRIHLIVVQFADRLLDFDAVPAAAAMGAAGIMLDTADKGAGSLLAHLDRRDIASFVARAKAYDLVVGLAGSLTAADVPKLLPLAPDLIGFRGALCHGSRSASLDPAACASIRALIPCESPATEIRVEERMPAAAAEALC